MCAAPKTMCKTKCVDTKIDVNNCGGCDKTCPKPEVCSKGACAASCAAGLTSCYRGCVDLKTDANHCGKCYSKCPAPKKCVAGSCV
jgi:hypothetical protein